MDTQRVSDFFQSSPGRWGKACPYGCLLAGLLILLPRAAGAHDRLGAYVQHAVRLAVDAQYIDVTIDLTFFEQWSAFERQAMDADGNGVITRSEQEAYLKKVEADTRKQVRLFVAGQEVPLAPLYPPEIDLLGNNRVGPAHHRLRLCFFCSTPAGLRAGDDVAVKDGLWSAANILMTSQVDGGDGCRLATGAPTNPDLMQQKAVQPRRVTFKCLQPPLTRSAPQPERRSGLGIAVPKPTDAGGEFSPPTNRTKL